MSVHETSDASQMRDEILDLPVNAELDAHERRDLARRLSGMSFQQLCSERRRTAARNYE